MSEAPMERKSSNPNAPCPINPDRARVLLADPQALFLEGLRALLQTNFAVVGQVAGGEALVSEALRLRPALVLTELRLSGRGGLEAARRVLAECPGTRVVFVTAVEDDGLAAEAFALGASGYLLRARPPPSSWPACERRRRVGRRCPRAWPAGAPRRCRRASPALAAG